MRNLLRELKSNLLDNASFRYKWDSNEDMSDDRRAELAALVPQIARHVRRSLGGYCVSSRYGRALTRKIRLHIPSSGQGVKRPVQVHLSQVLKHITTTQN